jgi:hypothetical protein
MTGSVEHWKAMTVILHVKPSGLSLHLKQGMSEKDVGPVVLSHFEH